MMYTIKSALLAKIFLTESMEYSFLLDDKEQSGARTNL